MEFYKQFKERLLEAKEKSEAIKQAEVVVWGAGNTSLLYKSCFDYEKIDPKYFCDKNKEKQGKLFCGKEIIAPEDIKERCKNPIIIISSANPMVCMSIKRQCIEMEVEYCLSDEIVFFRHMDEILDNYINLIDSVSRQVYREIILCRMEGIPVQEKIYSDKQYFCLSHFLQRNPSEVFVDCGAFVGDSIEQYIWNKAGTFGKVYGFEPDRNNYNAMLQRFVRINKEWAFSKEKIVPVLAGIGSITGKMQVENQGQDASSVSTRIIQNEGGKIAVYALDDYFKNDHISFIKADIEGMERELILGGEKIIKREHPLIAICIYHNATDMYFIMQMLRKLDNTYKFAVRHHSYEYCETVLYAW